MADSSTFSSSSVELSVALYHDFDAYVSNLIGQEVSTGMGMLDLEALSDEFRRQLVIDLEEQRARFAEEDRKLAAYIATLKAAGDSKSSDNSNKSASQNADNGNEEEDEEDFDEELLELDPVEYRRHDLYKVLGLEKRRWLATPEEIKAAYRKRVVKHHPDKLKQNPRRKTLNNPQLEDDSFFKLIQKAWQVLTDAGRKADYDSCDPTFDESLPEDREYASDAEFLAAFAPVFERNARFSKKQPAPSLGNEESPRSEVEAFYSFWINVESWRRFEWMDEDEPAGTDNRADKRWHEKKNKAKRDARKKEDNTRLIRLVEMAMKRDPRMLRWKEVDRAARNAKKNSKADALRAAKEAEAAQKAVEAAEKAQREAAEKAAKENAAVGKAAAKAALKASRKAFRDALGPLESWSANLVADIKSVQALGLTIERILTATAEDTPRLDRITAKIAGMVASYGGKPCGHLKELSEFLQAAESNAADLNESETETTIKVESESITIKVDSDSVTIKVESESVTVVEHTHHSNHFVWSVDEVDLLINAVKQYPGGTTKRWEQITSVLNRQISNHRGAEISLSVDAVLAEANKLQSAKEAAAREAEKDHRDEAQTLAALNAAKKKRDPRVDMAEPTVAAHYFVDETSTAATVAAKENCQVTWAPEDQLALESALKTVAADDPERWDHVAALVPGKSKRDCVARVKEIAAMLKSKNSAA